MSNLHPFLVHFPIALLSICLVFEVAALATGREDLSRTGWWLQLTGTFGLLGAVLGGLRAEQTAQIPPEWVGTFQTHEQLAFLTAVVFAALLFWRAAARSAIPPKGRGLFYALLVAGVGLLLAVAWIGGEMVFRGRIGVQ